jgi:hypothetical protein
MNRKAHALIAAALTISGLMASSSASACGGFIACALKDAGLITVQQARQLGTPWTRIGNSVEREIAADANTVLLEYCAVIERKRVVQRFLSRPEHREQDASVPYKCIP